MVTINYKTKIVDGREVYYASEWIYELENEIHFNWYYHQAEMVYSNFKRDQKILEIGLGTGLLSGLLKKRKWNVKTLDIDKDKYPDFCESAIDFDYRGNGVEAILAFEIFEHIPFPTFKNVVEKISQSEVTAICFSLPWCERELLGFSLKLPKIKKIQWSLRVPRKSISTKAHFWELSFAEKAMGEKRLVKLCTIYRLFEDYGYKVNCEKKVGRIQYFTAKR